MIRILRLRPESLYYFPRKIIPGSECSTYSNIHCYCKEQSVFINKSPSFSVLKIHQFVQFNNILNPTQICGVKNIYFTKSIGKLPKCPLRNMSVKIFMNRSDQQYCINSDYIFIVYFIYTIQKQN